MGKISGNIKRIDLGSSSFEHLIKDGNLYIDKSKFIENFLDEANSAQLVVRQRRLGKSLNLDMLKCFLTDLRDHRELFKGLYIENSPVWEQAHSAPVFLFDFKNLNARDYRMQIFNQIDKHIASYVNVDGLTGYLKRRFEGLVNDPQNNTEGLLILTELVYAATGKRSYILIDEYDKLLTDNYDSDQYNEIKAYETHLLTAGLKGNEYLKKALLTGVMRVSRESILSGFNNLQTYDLFSDRLYTYDFGLTEAEIDELNCLSPFDKQEIKEWYNGIKINGQAIYNIYSVLSCLKTKSIENYWGRSGTIEIIKRLMNSDREKAISKLLNHEIIFASVSRRISLHELTSDPDDGIFYSLLVQSGYLSLEEMKDENSLAKLTIPNKELMAVWKDFILSTVVKNKDQMKTIFDHIDDLALFSEDLESFLSDKLSYHDIAGHIDETSGKVKESIYHVFVLGLLSAYDDISYQKPFSNRESGDGRYDILFERKEFSIIFEFKSVANASELENAALKGLQQIENKRYFADVPKGKRLIKSAVAFCGKRCKVCCSYHS